MESVHKYEVDILNQGDISVNYNILPNTTPFGSRFAFSPSEGRLEVDGIQTIEITFEPNILGKIFKVKIIYIFFLFVINHI